jgi:hypothetical protein
VNSTAVTLVLVAALAHALWNFAAKRAAGGGVLFVWLYQTVSTGIRLPVAAAWLAVDGAQPRWSWLFAVTVSAALHVGYSLAVRRICGAALVLLGIAAIALA